MSAFCHTVALAPRYRNGLVRFYAVALNLQNWRGQLR